MRGRAHARTIFTGFGVTGSMLAAIGATFLVASTILAFDRWPGDLVDPPASELAVASALVGAVTPVTDTIALPDAATAVPTAAAGSVAPAGAPEEPGPEGPVGPDRPPPTGPVSPPPVVVPPAGAASGSVGTPADNQLAVAVETATGATADAVRSAGATLSIVSPVTDLVGGLVDGAGQGVGGALRDLDGKDG